MSCMSRCLFLIVIHLLPSHVTSSYGGNLLPEDPVVCPNQGITITCILHDPPKPNHIFIFQLWVKDTKKTIYKSARDDDVNVLNETMAQFTLRNNNGRTKVTCLYRNESSNDTAMVGYPTIVSIQPRLVPIEKFICVVNNYDVSMNCSWNFGTAKMFGEFPEFELEWRAPEVSANWNKCPDLNYKYDYCFWSSRKEGDFTMKDIEVNITYKRLCDANGSTLIKVNADEIVKPYPVVDLSAYALNSSCISVQYWTNKSSPEFPKIHKINVRPIDNPDVTQEIGFETTRSTEKKIHERTFCNLHPYTNYEINVSIRPVGSISGYYSDPVTTRQITCSANLTYVCLNHSIQCSSNYTITVKARNINGTSENSSSLFIPEASIGTHPFDIIVEYLDSNNVSIRWQNIENSIGYVIFWCKNKEGQCQTSGSDAYWKRVPTNTTETFITINEQENHAQEYVYGLSVITEEGSSSFMWEECVYKKYAKPTRQPKNVVVSRASEYYTLVVTWDKLTCKSGEPYIYKYNVQINKTNGELLKTMDIDAFEESRVEIPGLEVQRYSVTVRGVTEDGHYSPGSIKHGTPKDGSLPGWSIAVIVTSVIVFLIGVIIVALRKYVLNVRKSTKRICVEEYSEEHMELHSFLPVEDDRNLNTNNDSEGHLPNLQNGNLTNHQEDADSNDRSSSGYARVCPVELRDVSTPTSCTAGEENGQRPNSGISSNNVTDAVDSKDDDNHHVNTNANCDEVQVDFRGNNPIHLQYIDPKENVVCNEDVATTSLVHGHLAGNDKLEDESTPTSCTAGEDTDQRLNSGIGSYTVTGAVDSKDDNNYQANDNEEFRKAKPIQLQYSEHPKVAKCNGKSSTTNLANYQLARDDGSEDDDNQHANDNRNETNHRKKNPIHLQYIDPREDAAYNSEKSSTNMDDSDSDVNDDGDYGEIESGKIDPNKLQYIDLPEYAACGGEISTTSMDDDNPHANYNEKLRGTNSNKKNPIHLTYIEPPKEHASIKDDYGGCDDRRNRNVIPLRNMNHSQEANFNGKTLIELNGQSSQSAETNNTIVGDKEVEDENTPTSCTAGEENGQRPNSGIGSNNVTDAVDSKDDDNHHVNTNANCDEVQVDFRGNDPIHLQYIDPKENVVCNEDVATTSLVHGHLAGNDKLEDERRPTSCTAGEDTGQRLNSGIGSCTVTDAVDSNDDNNYQANDNEDFRKAKPIQLQYSEHPKVAKCNGKSSTTNLANYQLARDDGSEDDDNQHANDNRNETNHRKKNPIHLQYIDPREDAAYNSEKSSTNMDDSDSDVNDDGDYGEIESGKIDPNKLQYIDLPEYAACGGEISTTSIDDDNPHANYNEKLRGTNSHKKNPIHLTYIEPPKEHASIKDDYGGCDDRRNRNFIPLRNMNHSQEANFNGKTLIELNGQSSQSAETNNTIVGDQEVEDTRTNNDSVNVMT